LVLLLSVCNLIDGFIHTLIHNNWEAVI
jgi:hypothetical protein